MRQPLNDHAPLLFHCHPEAAQAFAKRRPANEGSLHFYLGHHGTMRPEKKARSRLNLAGQRVVVSTLACVRRSDAAMSAKGPALAKYARRAAARPLLRVVKAWASPQAPACVCGESLGQPPGCRLRRRGTSSRA